MGKIIKIIASIPVELEERLREYTHRRGDLSNIVTEALEAWLKKQKGS